MSMFLWMPNLPAGLNSMEINGDEVNSAGTNPIVWPALTESAVVLPIMALGDIDYNVFSCIDMSISAENRRIGIGAENRVIVMSRRCVA